MLLAPEFMPVGFAVKDAIEGAEPVPCVASDEDVVPAQLVRPMQANRIRDNTLRLSPEGRRFERESGEFAIAPTSLLIAF